MTQRMSTLTTDPVTLEPMTPTMKTVYRAGFYDAGGHLVKHQEAWPEMDNPNLQMIADISAGSHQPLMGAGTVVVWEDADTDPPPHLSLLSGDQWAWCHFGPDQAAVPQYRHEVDDVARTIMTFPKRAS